MAPQTPDRPSFSNWLKEQRRALGLTQRGLAERLGYSTETIVKIESGERRASREVAERLAACLDILPADRDAFVQFARTDQPPTSQLGSIDPVAPPLPTPPNAFVGRAAELATIGTLLGSEDIRLLTFTGAPGIGKTRLALHVAAGLRSTFPQGVYFVPLATIVEPERVLPAIAVALDVRESGRRSLSDSLKNYLRDKRILLVLDNCEQVVAAGPLIADLLQAAPRLKVLATSRVRLRLYGEHELRIPPLRLPDRRRRPMAADVAQAEAVALFTARARAAQPTFAVTDENASAVADICRRLDGLPLALELAAARVRTLAPDTLVARLDTAAGSPLQVLTGGPQDLPARQRTMRAALAWSYDSLAPGTQAVFRHLGVFAGGAALPQIAAVTSAASGSQAPAAGEVLTNALTDLVDSNLLKDAAPGSEIRFVMLETIREYALERLAAHGEAAAARAVHASTFLSLAEAAAPALQGPESNHWLDRLEREHDNLQVALAWATAAAGPVALRLAAALTPFWFRRGYLSAVRGRL
ncbi:MAG TPA: helix-turn-helix domain-containing protein, partial [Chloroflexia bacterium]|nr:helix-turn-helix domain-containing protein [Chloroflexia bacterium]